MTLTDKLSLNARPLSFALAFMLGGCNGLILRAGLGYLVFCLAVLAIILGTATYFFRKTACVLDIWRGQLRNIVWGFAGFLLGLASIFVLAEDVCAQSTGINPPEITAIGGRLVNDAIRTDHSWRAMVRIHHVQSRNRITCQCRFDAMVYFDSDIGLHAGDGVEMDSVHITELENRNYAWLISASLRDRIPGTNVEQLRSGILSSCETAFAGLSSPVRGFCLALLFGRQDELDADMQLAFYRSGCAHLVALSGMHIALVAALLVRILSPVVGIVIGRSTGFIGAIFFIWLVGPFPSAIRALLMFGILQGGALLGRRISGVAALCLSGPLLAIINPLMPLSLGFQLSFWALLGIMLWQDSLHARLRKPLLPLLSLEISTGVSAQLCTAPLLWTRGLAVYPQGIIAGILLAPLVLLFMGVALLALIVGLLAGPFAASVLEWPLQKLYWLILMTGGLFAG